MSELDTIGPCDGINDRTTLAVASGSGTASTAAAGSSLCLIHTDWPALDFSAVQPLYCGISRLVGCHFDKTEAAGPVGCTVHYHLRTFHLPSFGESVLQVLIGHSPGQIANVQSAPH
jgi:hypothetical protein